MHLFSISHLHKGKNLKNKLIGVSQTDFTIKHVLYNSFISSFEMTSHEILLKLKYKNLRKNKSQQLSST